MRHVVILLCVLSALATFALTPDQVLVIANKNSPESVQVAEAYVEARKIPKQNVLLITTGTGYHITRADYELQIRRPVRDYLVQKKLAGKIRCLTLMWGVPVKIGMQDNPSIDPEVATLYKNALDTAARRIARDAALLDRVGSPCPVPGYGLLSVESMFSAPLPTPEPSSDIQNLLTRIPAHIAAKRVEINGMVSAGQRNDATRQLKAIRLDLYGLNGALTMTKEDTPDNTIALQQIQSRYDASLKREVPLRWADISPSATKELFAALEEAGGVMRLYTYISETITPGYRDAAVDNELAMLWYGNYPTLMSEPNPLYHKHDGSWLPKDISLPKGVAWPGVLMAARIDGPTAADALRMIQDSIEVEKTGLTGTVYIDAGGIYPKYDSHLEAFKTFIEKQTKLKVVMDTDKELFKPGTCPDAALYVGWYRLCTYEPAFTWNKGAFGWHIASFEAANLRDPNTNEWCAKMIQNGVAGTLGPVSEPYLHAFPLPEEFFPMLLTGKYTLAECYWRTLPEVSWQMTLIADPLYRPFAKNPQVNVKLIPEGMR